MTLGFLANAPRARSTGRTKNADRVIFFIWICGW
jgi:hypothetical protein